MTDAEVRACGVGSDVWRAMSVFGSGWREEAEEEDRRREAALKQGVKEVAKETASTKNDGRSSSSPDCSHLEDTDSSSSSDTVHSSESSNHSQGTCVGSLDRGDDDSISGEKIVAHAHPSDAVVAILPVVDLVP